MATMLAGCTTFSKDRGFDAIEATAQAKLDKHAIWARSDQDWSRIGELVDGLLSRTLTAEDATQIALLNNRGLQATYQELGIAEADLVQAGRMTNPHFAYLRTRYGDERKLEAALTFPVVDFLTIPLRTKLERRRFEAVQFAVSGRVVDVAIDTRRAYFQAVAAEQTVRYMEQVNLAAEAAAELARRMARAGNYSQIAYMREQAFYAEVIVQLARARQFAISSRERLTRLMGLSGDKTAFKLPERLPDLPATLPEMDDLEATAMTQRLDVQAARKDTEGLAASLGLTKATRFINALELGPARTKEDPEPWKRGFEISLQVPLFDWGDARVAKAEAIYMQSVNELAEIAVNARSEVRETYAAYRTAYETAKHYRDEVVPLRLRISEENQLRYNAMLISVFELLADAREQVASVNAAIDAQAEYWLAESELQTALIGPSHLMERRDVAPALGGRMINPVAAGH